MHRPEPNQASWGRRSWVSTGIKPSFAAYVRIYLHYSVITTRASSQQLFAPHRTAACSALRVEGCFVFGKHARSCLSKRSFPPTLTLSCLFCSSVLAGHSGLERHYNKLSDGSPLGLSVRESVPVIKLSSTERPYTQQHHLR
jgi:hypothetical protein